MGTKSLGRLIRRLKVLLRTGKSSQMYISPFGTVSRCVVNVPTAVSLRSAVVIHLLGTT